MSATMWLSACTLWTVWGLNFVVMKLAMQDCGPYTFAMLRSVLGLIPLFIFLLWKKKLSLKNNIYKIMLVGLLQTSGFAGLTALALVNGAAGKTAILIFTMPFWVLGISILYGARLERIIIVVNFSALIGLLLILQPWSGNIDLVNKALALLAAIFLAIATILVKRISQKDFIDPVTLVFWQMLFGCVPLVLMYCFIEEKNIHYSHQFMWCLFYSSVLANSLAWPIWYNLLQKLPAIVASFNILAIPALGLLFSNLILREPIEAIESYGITLIFASLIALYFYQYLNQKVT